MEDERQLLTISANPHIRGNASTRRIMADLLIALAPVTVAAVVLFGLRVLAVVAACVIGAVLSEFVFDKIVKKPNTVSDLSAAVTGLILALNLPSTIPLWEAVLGAIVAVVVTKCLFGGLGQNFANPALVGRIILFIAFTGDMKAAACTLSSLRADLVTCATPLTQLNNGEAVTATLKELLLGTHGGMLGETCALALLVGGIYLLCRRVITWHIPVSIFATVALFALCCGRDPLTELLSGGLILGAVFMATDYVTSPITPVGKLVYGVVIGLIVMFIRVFCAFPEGVSFAILLGNILTPYIEAATKVKPFGTKPVKGGKAA